MFVDGATLTIEAGHAHHRRDRHQRHARHCPRRPDLRRRTSGCAHRHDQRSARGLRDRADWGGLIINGNAPINVPGGEAIGEGDTGRYGGTNPDDSSGVLRYVRVEYAGTEFSPDNELNGIAFQGVGRGTQVEFVQVHFNQDDGIEFFGGTVDVKYAVVHRDRRRQLRLDRRLAGQGAVSGSPSSTATTPTRASRPTTTRENNDLAAALESDDLQRDAHR